MFTEWMKNLNQELENVTQDDIRAAEPKQDFPDKRCIMGELGEGIRRMVALKKRYCDLVLKYDERYEGFEEQGKEYSVEAEKLHNEIKRLIMNIEVLEGMISLSILNAFPELFYKEALIMIKGWKIIGVDAKIVIREKPDRRFSQN